MSAPQAPSAELADATRTAIAMCAASHRGDMDGWAQLVNSFRWPRANRRYLSRKEAERRAALLESYGAKVAIERSQPVVWADLEAAL